MNTTDPELLALLKKDRERGAVLLLETYTGLLWSVCARRLANPEDIKECVNAVFADFCQHIERFDEQQGSLKNYLSIMADRQALDLYRQNQRHKRREEAAAEKMAELDAENAEKIHRELEDALKQLEPMDEKILRMKYYGGMSYIEIAKNLNLPYETVKKRGKRNLKKLAKLLLLGILLLLLAACAALVLRYFQFIPGHGFNWDTDSAAYQLAYQPEPLYVDDIIISITEATYVNGILTVTATVEYTKVPDSEEDILRQNIIKTGYGNSLKGDDLEFISARFSEDSSTEVLEYKSVMDTSAESIEFHLSLSPTILSDGRSGIYLNLPSKQEDFPGTAALEFIPMTPVENAFTLTLARAATEEDMSDLTLIYYSADNGFVIKDKTADEEGIVLSLYQLDSSGTYQFSDLLIDHYMGIGGHEREAVSLTDMDGNVYVAGMIRNYGSSDYAERRITFPGAPAGKYVLHIPYICMQSSQETDSTILPLPGKDISRTECDSTLLFPDGSGIHITGITRITDTFDEEVTINEYQKVRKGWGYLLEMDYISTDFLTLSSVYAEVIYDKEAELSSDTPVMYGFNLMLDAGKIYLFCDYETPPAQVQLYFISPVYILDQSFDVELDIE